MSDGFEIIKYQSEDEMKVREYLYDSSEATVPKIEKLYQLYVKQLSAYAVLDEIKEFVPLMFHVLLGQILRKPNRGSLLKFETVPYEYLISTDTCSSIRVHIFMIARSRGGKGTIMRNTITLFGDVCKIMGWDSKNNSDCGLRSYMLDDEPTVQFLKGGNEQNVEIIGKVTGNEKDKKRKRRNQWGLIEGMISTQSLIGFDEGEVLIDPESRYGDLKRVLLGVADTGKETLSLTARKDLVGADGTPLKQPPLVPISSSLMTGSVPLNCINEQINEKGLFQRFLIAFPDVDYDGSIAAIAKHAVNVASHKSKLYDDARINFCKYFKNEVFAEYDSNFLVLGYPPIDITISAAKRFSEIILNEIGDKRSGYRGNKLSTYISFIGGIQSHIWKIASHAAIVEGTDALIEERHIEYAWKVCKPVWNAYMKLFEQVFRPDRTDAERKRISIVLKIVEKELQGKIIQSHLINKLRHFKSIGNWDLGYVSTHSFIRQLIIQGILEKQPDGHLKVGK